MHRGEAAVAKGAGERIVLKRGDRQRLQATCRHEGCLATVLSAAGLWLGAVAPMQPRKLSPLFPRLFQVTNSGQFTLVENDGSGHCVRWKCELTTSKQ